MHTGISLETSLGWTFTPPPLSNFTYSRVNAFPTCKSSLLQAPYNTNNSTHTLSSSDFFVTRKKHWFAYQVGTKANNLFINNDRFILEHSWSDHRVYRHQNEINDYYSHGYPLGFWAGPHAQEIFINYMFSKFNLDIFISYSHSKRGELTSSMLEGQYDNIHYERFSNISEELSVCKILIFKEVKKGFNLHFGVSNIDWKNGNFNPNPSEFEINDLVDISKFSFTLGFSQNFDIFNQTSKITDNSIKKIITF